MRVLKNNELVGFMGRVASAADSAAIESFHALLQKNVPSSRRWETREELRLALVTWIEKKYRRQRRKHRLGKMTRVEFEALDRALPAAWNRKPIPSTKPTAAPRFDSTNLVTFIKCRERFINSHEHATMFVSWDIEEAEGTVETAGRLVNWIYCYESRGGAFAGSSRAIDGIN
jgi:hypothetical protein